MSVQNNTVPLVTCCFASYGLGWVSLAGVGCVSIPTASALGTCDIEQTDFTLLLLWTRCLND